MGIKKFVLNNIGLKLFALLLAAVSWVYIVGELNKATPEEKAALERLLPYRMTAKFLPVELNLVGSMKSGFQVDMHNVIIEPEGIMVVGPRNLLDRVSSVKTEAIDITEATKPFSKNVTLMPLAKGLSIKERFVTVNIPVIKVKE